ncbi:MAG: DNA-methyltransferase [Culicoidibacterales bacterium]
MIQLIKGDCLIEMQNIPDKSVDMICADLPYGTTSLKWDSIIPFEPLWAHYKRIIKDNGAIVLFGSQPFTSALVMSNVKMFKYSFNWIKTKAGNFALCKKNPMKLHEDILVFYNKFPTYNLFDLKKIEKPIKSSRKNKGANLGHCVDNGNYSQTETGYHKSNLYFSNKSGAGYSFHPTQKPVPLLEYLIKTYTNEGETVLDNTFGSCTTGIACLNTNRNFIGIEMDDKYFEIASKRIGEALSDLKLQL